MACEGAPGAADLRWCVVVGCYNVGERSSASAMPGRSEGGDGPTRTQVIEELIELVHDSVGRPEDWSGLGGKSDVREMMGTLMVKTTRRNHVDLESFLGMIREAIAKQEAVGKVEKSSEAGAER